MAELKLVPWSAVLPAALHRLDVYTRLVGDLGNVDEATFRSFLMAEIAAKAKPSRLQIEWKRVDLLVEIGGKGVVVELKFFRYSRWFSIGDTSGHYKGGAGDQNAREFNACLKKLRDFPDKTVAAKYLLLLYEKRLPLSRRAKTFTQYYDNLQVPTFARLVDDSVMPRSDFMACRLLVID